MSASLTLAIVAKSRKTAAHGTRGSWHGTPVELTVDTVIGTGPPRQDILLCEGGDTCTPSWISVDNLGCWNALEHQHLAILGQQFIRRLSFKCIPHVPLCWCALCVARRWLCVCEDRNPGAWRVAPSFEYATFGLPAMSDKPTIANRFAISTQG